MEFRPPRKIKLWFDCNDVRELTKYVGCKINRNKNSIKFTQPVLLQSFEDEFEFAGSKVKVQAEAGSVLVRNKWESLSEGAKTKYQSSVGKLLCMVRWSRPEIYNVIHELSRFMTGGTSQVHIKAMRRVMEYFLGARAIVLVLEPHQSRDRNPEFELLILGRLDSDYAKVLETRKSVSGTSAFLCRAPIIQKIAMQKIVALSVTSGHNCS